MKKIIILFVVTLFSFQNNAQDFHDYSIEGLAKVCANCECLSSFHDGLAIIIKNNKFGLIDKQGNEVVPCKYNNIDKFSDGLAVVVNDNHQYGVIDKQGNEVVPCKYSNIKKFNEGLAVVENDNYKYGVIDKQGNEVVSCKYRDIESFCEGLAIVHNDNHQYGVIDKQGNEVVPCKYNRINDFSEGVAIVENDNYKYGLIDKQGNEVVPCKYNMIKDFSEGFAAVAIKSNNSIKYGYINTEGKEIIPCTLNYQPENFKNGFAIIEKTINGNRGKGLINTLGKEILPCVYNAIGEFSDGIAYVRTKADKSMFVDKNGKIVFNLNGKFTNVWGFSEGMCVVTESFPDSNSSDGVEIWREKCGFIDKEGKLVIPKKYSSANNFSEGISRVAKDGQWGCIDKHENIIIPFSYKYIDEFIGDIAVVKIEKNKKKQYSFINKNGKVITNLIFSKAEGFSEGLAAVQKDGQWGYIDKQGKCTFDY